MNPLSPASILSLATRSKMNKGKTNPRSSSKQRIIKIPCKPHVLAFLKSKYETPYKLSLADWLGISIYHILKRQESDKYVIANPKEYCEKLQVLVPENTIFNYGLINVTDYTIYKINNLVEDLISDRFLDYVSERPEGMLVKEAILDWMAKYDFLESTFINYANLKQKYFRYRRALKDKK